MKIVYKAKDITEAHIVSGMLNANGIKAYVGGHYLQGGVGELAAMDYANVQVADEDISAARLLISEYESVPQGADVEMKLDETVVREKSLGPKIVISVLVVVFIFSVFILASSSG